MQHLAQFLVECRKQHGIALFLFLLRTVIGLKNSHHSLNQLAVIAAWSGHMSVFSVRFIVLLTRCIGYAVIALV